MKKLIIIVATMLVTTTASADSWHHHGHYDRGPIIVHNDNWVGPAIVTGVLGYAIGRSTVPTQPVIVQQSPQTYPGPVAYPSQYPVYVERQSCGPWTEIQNQDGTSSRTRTCN